MSPVFLHKCTQARAERVAAAAAAAATQLNARTMASSARTAPKTSTEFEAVWRSLKGDQVLQVSFIFYFCTLTCLLLLSPLGTYRFTLHSLSHTLTNTQQARYLAIVPPATLPSVFKASLTPQLLLGILRTLLIGAAASQPSANSTQQQGEEEGGALKAAQVGGLLKGLAGVPRLAMAAMCVPGKDRAELKQLWEQAKAVCGGNALSDAEWESLRAVFKV